MLIDLALALSIAVNPQQRAPAPSQEGDVVAAIEAGLRRYFASDSANGPELADVLAVSKGHADVLQRVLRSNSFVPSPGPVARHGVIDAKDRFVDAPARRPPPSSPPLALDGIAAPTHFALLYGTHESELNNLVVYVPDVQATGVFERAMEMEKSTPGRFVFLVPDEKQKDQVKKECAFMKGTSAAGNQIQVTTQGIGRLRIWFDPELIDCQRKVSVTINGKARPPVTISMDAAAMLRHVHATGDTSRLYMASAEYGDLEVRK